MPAYASWALFLTACAYNGGMRAGEYPAPAVRSVHSVGQPVYSADECIGPVIMGVCHGQILPKRAYHPRCYGQMLNGVCTGPMF